MRLVDADAFAMYLQLVCKGNDMSAEKKVFSANGIIHMLQDMPTASDIKWIPVTEKLPEKTGHYLCSFKKPNRIDNIFVDLAYWTGGKWYGYLANEINAWMPLPEPYEVKNETD